MPSHWVGYGCQKCHKQEKLYVCGTLHYCVECASKYEQALMDLRCIEQAQNDGRGVTCVRSIIFFLERGDQRSAQICADTDHDKLRQYDAKLEATIVAALWPEGDAPKWWRTE